MPFEIRDRVLVLPDSSNVTFDFPIKEAHEVAGIVVLVLDIPAKQYMTENVFGVSTTGEVIWQIERIPETASDRENQYVGLIPRTDELITACNWNGTASLVYVKTGKVHSNYITK